MKVTKDMLSWCYALDVVKWLSHDASKTGDYTAVETIALTNKSGEVLVVPDDEYEASVIYCAMIHLPALVSFIDEWHAVDWYEGTLTFYSSDKYIEQANCKYNPSIDDKKDSWTREWLESVWKRMRT